VLKYNGTTGAFISAFVTAGAGGLSCPTGMLFGTDGNLYVCAWSANKIMKFDGSAGFFISDVAAANEGGLTNPYNIAFQPTSNPCPADLFPVGVGDGIVGPGDLAQLLSKWGQCGQ